MQSLNFLYQFGRNIGGFYSYYYELFQKLQQNSIKQTIITNHIPVMPNEKFDSFSVYKVGYYKKKVGKNPLKWMISDLISYSNSERMANLAIKLHRQKKIDIINAYHDINCGLAAKLTKSKLKIPMIFHVITGLRHLFYRPPQFRNFPYIKKMVTQSYNLNRTVKMLYNKFVKGSFRALPKIFAHSDLIIVPSHSSEKDVLHFGADPEKVKIIPFAVDTDKFSNKHSQESLRNVNLPEKPLLLFVGRLSTTEKAVDDVLKAFKIILRTFAGAKLMIVGEGPEKSYLMRFSNRLRISHSVLFLGSKDYSEIPQLMASADVLLLPFKLDSRGLTADTFGRVIIEGMSCNKVVITTDARPFNEIIENNIDGLLVHAGDCQGMANTALKVLQDSSYRRSIEKNARKKVEEQYSFPVIVKKMINAYKSVHSEFQT